MKKRLSAILMTLALIVGCVMNGSLEAAAEEITSINPYVYYAQSVTASPFRVKMETASNDGRCQEAVLYTLTEQANNCSVEAYGIDADTEFGSAAYKRINLEDSAYFDELSAQKIRAIVKNGVTEKTKQQIQKEANEWLNARNEPEVISLTGAEALSATQYAIWSIANRECIVAEAPYSYYEVNDQAKCYATSNGNPITPMQPRQLETVNNGEDVVDISKQNINGVAKYLLSLAPEAANEVAVSDSTIENVTVTYKLAADETLTAVVTFDLTATVNEDTVLMAVVSAGEKSVSQAVTTAGTQTLSLPGLVSKADIKVEIIGTQKVSDVFFYEAEGGRTVSQSLVGVDSCLVPVHAEKVITAERVINFTKITSIEEDDGTTAEYPLEGISFDIYYVCSVNDFGENYATYKTPAIGNKQKLGQVTTDALGKATFNVTQAGGRDGVYLVAEHTDNPAIENPLAPFYVAVPSTAADGNGQYATLNLSLKNDVVDGPVIKKDVTKIENDRDSFDIDEEHTWIIRSGIPVDMENGKSYVISDTLDYRLTYKDGLTVKVAEAADAAHTEPSENVLTEGSDYTVAFYNMAAENAADVSGGDALMTKKIVISLTRTGMQKVASIAGTNYAACEVRVYYNTVINNYAAMGEEIPNQAFLEYTSSVNFNYDAKSDVPVVYTCGINIDKYDAKDAAKPLAGAEFKLARKATEAEIADESIETFPLVIGRGESLEIVFVDFYDNADLNGERVDRVTTGEDGKAVIYGLKELFEADPEDEEGDGDGVKAAPYYLVEIKAPAGYNLLKFPKEIFLNLESHLDTGRVGVANSNAFQLPDTGGIGTAIFTLVGAALTVGSGAVLVGKKRKEEE